MTEEFKRFALVEGEVLPCTIEGYTIECKAVLENLNIVQNIVVGVLPKGTDALSKVVGAISTGVGPANRIKIANIMESINVEWPFEVSTGIPAYLEGCK
jgi:hypothetical protein